MKLNLFLTISCTSALVIQPDLYEQLGWTNCGSSVLTVDSYNVVPYPLTSSTPSLGIQVSVLTTDTIVGGATASIIGTTPAGLTDFINQGLALFSQSYSVCDSITNGTCPLSGKVYFSFTDLALPAGTSGPIYVTIRLLNGDGSSSSPVVKREISSISGQTVVCMSGSVNVYP